VSNLLEADLYVMTSHIENNANNLCEAMILGLPCISTFVGGMGSLIRNNIEGILIQSGDPWAMAGAVIELIQDKHKALELGDSARKAALHRHDKKRIINGIISTYHEIIDGN
jgi:glycosyltransferase involved in cell wall biosynthesis